MSEMIGRAALAALLGVISVGSISHAAAEGIWHQPQFAHRDEGLPDVEFTGSATPQDNSGDHKPERKDGDSVREKVADEAANRMGLLGVLFFFGTISALLFARMTGWWR